MSPELLARMSVDKWLDEGISRSMTNESTWPIHDRILGVQASALTMVMNPTTLRRVYDNEFRLPPDQDMLSLPELLATLRTAVWSELAEDCPPNRNDRQPMISSLRRNPLRRTSGSFDRSDVEGQRSQHCPKKPISNLAMMQMKELRDQIDASIGKCGEKMDAYTKAHLMECQTRIKKALDAGYVFNGGSSGPQQIMLMLSGEETDSK
ncbi:MAG: zinc-dependent metalloprotease [Pirellulaceae bacterium]